MPGFLLAILFLGADVSSMRCGDLLVLPGASKLDVVSRCGEPDWRERISGADDALEEVWIYDLPEKNAQKLLHFEGVTLASIRDAGATPGNGAIRCGDVLMQAGVSKLTVRKQCGKPAIVEAVSGDEAGAREVWLYDRDDVTVEFHFAGVELERVVSRGR